MKIALSVILAVLFVSITSPLSLTVVPVDACTYLVTEDICDSPGNALSVSAEHAVLLSGLCMVFYPACTGCVAVSYEPHKQFVIPARTDHPPEAQLS